MKCPHCDKEIVMVKHHSDLDEADLAAMAHLLPQELVTLITVAGLDAAMTLVSHYGGTRIPVGKNQTRFGKVLFAMLADIVGDVAAEKITAAYGTQRSLTIPKCTAVLTELKHRAIRREFDALSKNMSYQLVINNLALAHNMTERHIQRVINAENIEPSKDESQLTLF